MPVRTIGQDGDPWLVAFKKHCKCAETFKQNESFGLEIGPRGVTIIPEMDLYRLMMKSKLPAAMKFEEWVVVDVLPSIHKKDSYTVKECKPHYA